MVKVNITLLWQRLLHYLTPLPPHPKGLLESVQEAQAAWHKALQDFNYFTDAELIDYGVLNIKTTERRYIALLKQAQLENVTAWPAELTLTPSKPQTNVTTSTGGD